MCGIFGVISYGENLSIKKYYNILTNLFLLSESRGKEASGFVTLRKDTFYIYKTPFSGKFIIKSKIFKRFFKDYNDSTKVTIGHSRLVTNGYEHFNENNQPVEKGGAIVVHNGIIVNQKNLWEKYNNLSRKTDLDSELIPTLLRYYLDSGEELLESFRKLFNEIYGMTSIAVLFNDYHNLILATNNGSLYYLYDKEGIILFASEFYILSEIISKFKFSRFSNNDIKQVNPNTLVSYNYNKNLLLSFNFLDKKKTSNIEKNSFTYKIKEVSGEQQLKNIYINRSLEHSQVNVPTKFIEHYQECYEKIQNLIRCKKCILPNTFPYIEFDENGICNYCNNYKKINYKGKDSLLSSVNKYRNNFNKPECLIPFSGGRDSSYVLHYVVTELKLKPIAFSYDWGMITDLARRNQARMCGKLGVEHILVSADIRKKREYIRKNVLAWLKRPNLGTVPLFMAGDKQYFYFTNLLLKQNNISLSIYGENNLENTNFKSAFCKIKPKFNKKNIYELDFTDKIKMFLFYGKEYLLNPAYINKSLYDTFDAFRSYYLIKHNNINFYNYIKWDENEIINTLINEYDWETDPGTKTTWRIGDGTAAFYNYIYYIVAGFSEIDTFRSNQIREGDLTREEALKLSLEENKPRWDSIKWYCDTIGIDFEKAISIINSINKLYNVL